MAASVCVESQSGLPARNRSMLDRLRAAQIALQRDGGLFDRVQVQLCAVTLSPSGVGVVASTGSLPVYLVSDRYAARVDPRVASTRGLMTADIDARMVRNINVRTGQQLLMASTVLEDLGLTMHWPLDAAVGGAAWLARQADEVASRSGSGFVLASLTAPSPPRALSE
jgi:hypothetical protein